MGGCPFDWKSSHFISGNRQKACFGFLPTDDGISGPKSCYPKVGVGQKSPNNNFYAPPQPGRMSLPFSSTLCFASFGCPFFNLEFEVIHRMRLLLWKTDFPSCLKIEKAGISQSVLSLKIPAYFSDSIKFY